MWLSLMNEQHEGEFINMANVARGQVDREYRGEKVFIVITLHWISGAAPAKYTEGNAAKIFHYLMGAKE